MKDGSSTFLFSLLSLSRAHSSLSQYIHIHLDANEHSTLTMHTVDASHVQMEDRIRWNDDTYHID